ncbi:gas vesicle protein [Streptomyces sp. ACA25]|uniref:gas vesicle protein GvpO n=1 Tax=Streptomyces sp. ACA25 TaxID=3022596 RepID=UPI002307DC50|nr:gas vesicle protein [Streptomyces sp. ACA25]MDB1088206.1 gas vesicle protein [Streptomyces sp. ACA25]
MAEQREKRSRTASRTGSGTAHRRSPVRGAADAARYAGQQLEELITHSVDGVSAVHRAENGWRVCVDIMEVPRIPDTTSLLATYEVELDDDGNLLQYRRVRRYRRNSADD